MTWKQCPKSHGMVSEDYIFKMEYDKQVSDKRFFICNFVRLEKTKDGSNWIKYGKHNYCDMLKQFVITPIWWQYDLSTPYHARIINEFSGWNISMVLDWEGQMAMKLHQTFETQSSMMMQFRLTLHYTMIWNYENVNSQCLITTFF